jgi:IMP dehydrogenase
VVVEGKKPVGIITEDDLQSVDRFTQLGQVMTQELTTMPDTLDPREAFDFLNEKVRTVAPVVSANGELVGIVTRTGALRATLYKPALDAKARLRIAAAVGINGDIAEKAAKLVSFGADVLVVDTAHGHQKKMIEALQVIKKLNLGVPIVAGNVVTAEGVRDLIAAGADIIKVGVGPGSICTTRIIAGIGVPQLTAVYESAKAIKGSGVPVIADGGIRYSGDLVKALAAGASTVMSGSIFAGVEESPGETVIYEGRKFKSYRGMGSIEAMKEGSKDRYFQDAEDEIAKLVPEGIVGIVPFKGLLKEVVYQFVGGLRAGMGYCGAKTVEELQENGKFIKITAAGAKESHAHDIKITKEAPNYSRN